MLSMSHDVPDATIEAYAQFLNSRASNVGTTRVMLRELIARLNLPPEVGDAPMKAALECVVVRARTRGDVDLEESLIQTRRQFSLVMGLDYDAYTKSITPNSWDARRYNLSPREDPQFVSVTRSTNRRTEKQFEMEYECDHRPLWAWALTLGIPADDRTWTKIVDQYSDALDYKCSLSAVHNGARAVIEEDTYDLWTDDVREYGDIVRMTGIAYPSDFKRHESEPHAALTMQSRSLAPEFRMLRDTRPDTIAEICKKIVDDVIWNLRPLGTVTNDRLGNIDRLRASKFEFVWPRITDEEAKSPIYTDASRVVGFKKVIVDKLIANFEYNAKLCRRVNFKAYEEIQDEIEARAALTKCIALENLSALTQDERNRMVDVTGRPMFVTSDAITSVLEGLDYEERLRGAIDVRIEIKKLVDVTTLDFPNPSARQTDEQFIEAALQVLGGEVSNVMGHLVTAEELRAFKPKAEAFEHAKNKIFKRLTRYVRTGDRSDDAKNECRAHITDIAADFAIATLVPMHRFVDRNIIDAAQARIDTAYDLLGRSFNAQNSALLRTASVMEYAKFISRDDFDVPPDEPYKLHLLRERIKESEHEIAIQPPPVTAAARDALATMRAKLDDLRSQLKAMTDAILVRKARQVKHVGVISLIHFTERYETDHALETQIKRIRESEGAVDRGAQEPIATASELRDSTYRRDYLSFKFALDEFKSFGFTRRLAEYASSIRGPGHDERAGSLLRAKLSQFSTDYSEFNDAYTRWFASRNVVRDALARSKSLKLHAALENKRESSMAEYNAGAKKKKRDAWTQRVFAFFCRNAKRHPDAWPFYKTIPNDIIAGTLTRARTINTYDVVVSRDARNNAITIIAVSAQTPTISTYHPIERNIERAEIPYKIQYWEDVLDRVTHPQNKPRITNECSDAMVAAVLCTTHHVATCMYSDIEYRDRRVPDALAPRRGSEGDEDVIEKIIAL